MSNPEFSFIILTYNEEQHIPRLLDSIRILGANTYILDSYSEDNTIAICHDYNITVAQSTFYNHPTQWHHALSTFQINTPWVICLDADQIVTQELIALLMDFKDQDHLDFDGIYFNRKNYFKGRWIRYGGYYPKYLLKMFRPNKGWSDLTENMDHRFQVHGKTLIWKTGHIIEENLKESSISFWIDKHNRYSSLLAEEEVQRIKNRFKQSIKPRLFGSPNEQNAWFKKLWWRLPRYLRPLIYFLYRIILQRGILDGKTGIIYHFLQAFWFRVLVDIKIDEHLKKRNGSESAIAFLLNFLMLSAVFYWINIFFIGLTTPGGFYIKCLDQHLNYIHHWRTASIYITSSVLRSLGYIVEVSGQGLSVKYHSGFKIVYSCLGYGIMSCFAAFVISFPKSARSKICFLITGLCLIQLINLLRLTLIAIFYRDVLMLWKIDHHALYNYLTYTIIIFITYIWTNSPGLKKHLIKENFLKVPQNLK
ncbi:glycosyltransferase [Pedobacter frigoris]|uniref:Glycosyltransferase n=1 Tax=Pedobacter frigoris TaxID=2571272 RepID=A0A4U1CP81_9SPHI|nr:glycosyltransferase [Pedobacter frigoris]TKC08640.1 glycosyltransferase [Pedobacter frigoris]